MRFWTKNIRFGESLLVALTYNKTFTMTDGRVKLYIDQDKDIPITIIQLRIGHLWLALDIAR